MRHRILICKVATFAVLGLFTHNIQNPTSPAAEENPAHSRPIKHRITGLCCPEREDDLRAAVGKMPGVELLRIDFENAEATFAYDPAKVFPGTPAGELDTQFHNLLMKASTYTFGIRPTPNVPREKLTLIEIPVLGLDCKGCSLAAYEAIYKIDGVEHATASFKRGRVTAWIDPAKANRTALEAALKAKGVELGQP